MPNKNEQLNKDLTYLYNLINWNELELGGCDDQYCYALGAKEIVKRLTAFVEKTAK